MTKVEDRNDMITMESCTTWNSKIIKSIILFMLSVSAASNKNSI